MRGARSGLCVLAAALWLAVGAPARAEIRLSDLTIYLNDYEVTVHVVALGAVPPTFYESIQSGIPAHVRFTIELWQYNRFWRDRLLTRSEEHTSELQSLAYLVCRLLLEKKKKK